MTSIEILAPYLPYGIEVEAEVVKDLEKRRAVLVGITHDPEDREPNERSVSVSLLQERSRWRWLPCTQVTPILRSFEDLVKPLEDGTVPAEEVSRLLTNDWADEYKHEVEESELNVCIVHISRWDAEVGDVKVYRLTVLKDWNLLLMWADNGAITHCENVSRAHDYLRSKHFAVGLQSDQYIKKA